jgi:lambda family phage portal protein
MSWLDRLVIAPLSPGWAARRARARMLYAAYEAADTSRLRRAQRKVMSANTENKRAVSSLRSEARRLEENFDIASGALDALVANVVGGGIAPEPQVMLKGSTTELAEDFNRLLLELWEDWIHVPEVTRQWDYYSLQRLAFRSVARDGEVFGQRLIGPTERLDHVTRVPYSLELLEADFVPDDYDDPSQGITQGITFNQWGAPTRYWVYKTHPLDNGTQVSVEKKPVAADRMLHVKLAKRLHQARGISVFAPVFTRFDDLKEIDESERVAARVAAAMSAYIKKGTPDDFSESDYAGMAGPGGEKPLRMIEFQPGMVFDDLLPGEDIGTIASSRPNNALIPFRDAQLRSAASGCSVSFSSLSKNYNGTYSAQRQELVEQYAVYRALTSAFVFRFCQPVWDGFIDAVRLTQGVDLSKVNLDTVYDASHTPPPMPWIDPEKEVSAQVIAEEHGYTSRSRIIRQRGDNPDQVYREIARDQKETERLGLSLRADQAARDAQAEREAAATEEEDESAQAGERERAQMAQLLKGVTDAVSAASRDVSVKIEPPPSPPRSLKVVRSATGEIESFEPVFDK